MRVTRVAARPEPASGVKPAWRGRESLLLLVVAALLAFGFSQVSRSKQTVLASAEERLASGQTLLLAKLTPAAEVARYLDAYDDPGQRQFIAKKISDYLLHHKPQNVGELASIRVTAAEAKQRHIEEGKLFTTDEFANRIKPAFAVRRPSDFRRMFRNWLLLFFAGFLLAHAAWTIIGFRGDQYVLPVVCLLSGIGMILMLSLRDPVRDMPVFAEFAGGVLSGCILLTVVTCVSHFLDLRRQGLLKRPSPAGELLDRIDERLRWIAKRGDIAFAAAMVLSAALLIFGTGPGQSGVKIRLLFFQPVEVVRLLLVLFFASYFARRWEFLRELKERRVRLGVNLPRLDHALPVMAAVALAIGFLFLQKDLGPAIVLAGLFLAVYAMARARVGLVLAASGVLAAVVWLAYRIGYPPVVVTRVSMWLQPWDNALAHGDQLVHSLWAMATGAVVGTGIGRGMPSVIPAGHTDLVLAVLAEECGFVGLAIVIAAYALLFWRSLRIATHAATAYEFFLAFGLTAALALQGALIAGGITGLLPLSGVVTPFLSYGGSATILDFLAAGLLLAISAKSRRKEPQGAFRKPVMAFSAALAVFACVLLVKAGSVQLAKADDVVTEGTLVQQEDGSYAMAYNPRLIAVARQIQRGAIYDRNGLPVATSDWNEIEKHRAEYAAAGIDLATACSRADRRHYPFGPAMFNVLGDLRTRLRWTASNASFEERVSRSALQGFDDREALDTVQIPRTDKKVRVYRRDYSELVPLLRAQMDPNDPAVRKVLDAPRSVKLAVDARLQLKLTRLFQEYLTAHNWRSGAIAVVHPVTGELLAEVSLPLPQTGEDSGAVPIDFARYGQYPPGSSFKLVTALAALRHDPALLKKTYECVRLPGGRIGNTVRGRLIRDDVMDKQPHGTPDMRRALIVSCNAYFAQLAAHDVGPQALQSTALLFNIETAVPNTPKKLNDFLPQAGYGQGEVLVTPFRMARVAAAIANRGQLAPVRVRLVPPEPVAAAPAAVLAPELTIELEKAMRSVMLSGTGRNAGDAPGGIAGKTGTAEVTGRPAHAWFVGFAPYDAPPARRVAFAILIENAGYGGRAAAPFAAKIAEAARDLAPVKEEASEQLEENPAGAAARPLGAAGDSKRDPGRDRRTGGAAR